MVVRLPSASEYALAVAKEHQWLPVLAPSLPLPIPNPSPKAHRLPDYQHFRGPSTGGSSGRPALPHSSPTRSRSPLSWPVPGGLQAVDATDGPQPGLHNWFRGGTLRTYDDNTRLALNQLRAHVDTDRARELWADALAAPWDGADRWFHGDVAQGNLLLDDAGQLAAVIDFGTCGVGDPACDLAIAWTLLTPDGRQTFRDRLAVDDPTWARGRGWALWKAVVTCWYAYEDPEGLEEFEEAKRLLEAILGE